MEIPLPQTSNDIYSYGFDKSLVKPLADNSTGVVYDINDLTAAQSLQFGNLQVGSNVKSFQVDPEQGLWLGAINFSDALFSVDMKGNAKVSSLKRNDFEWNTVFDSLDGFSSSHATAYSGYILLDTDVGIGELAWVLKNLLYFPSSFFNWDKKRSFRTSVYFRDNTNQDIYIIIGNIGGAEQRIGFHITDNEIKGVVNSTVAGTDTAVLYTLSAGEKIDFECNFYPNDRTDFVINGILSASITTNLPSASDSASIIIYAYVYCDDAADDINIRMSYWTFWQEGLSYAT